MSFCDPTTFQPELTLGCAVISSPNSPFPNVQWFVDQGAGAIPLSANTLSVRTANGRRTVGGTISLRQPFQPGRYFCQPRLLSNNSFLQPSQFFELKSISTYAGLLPCRPNDTLSVLSSRCADLNVPRNVLCVPDATSLASSVPTVTNAVDSNDLGGVSICAAISATGLTLLLVAVITTNIIVCYLFRQKSRAVAEKQKAAAGDHQLQENNSSQLASHHVSRNSASSTYYAYPEIPQSNRTQTAPSSFEHEISSDSYHTPYSLSLPLPPSPSQYAALRGAAEYSQHYTSR